MTRPTTTIARALVTTLALGATLATLALGACASVPQSGEERPGDFPRPRGGGVVDEDRILLTRFTDVLGLAASRRFVYVAGAAGLAVFDAQFDRWLPPRLTGERLAKGRLTAMAADPVSDAVWLGSVGEVIYYQPSMDFTTRAPIPGVAQAIVFDRRDPGRGALVRTQGGWQRVSTTGAVMPVMAGELPSRADVLESPSLEDVYSRYPALRDLGPAVTQDEQARNWPVTSGTIAPDRSEVYLGTQGNGVYRVDPDFVRGRQLPFGLLADGAGAVALAVDGVWVAPAGTVSFGRPRGGLTFVRDDLQEWRWVEDDYRGSLAGVRARDLAVRGSVAWMATDRGLARFDLRARAPGAVIWSSLQGLPTDVVYSVVPREGGAWAGTAQGLVWVSDTGRRVQSTADRVDETIASGIPVRALLATGDTLWIGTDAGLLLLPPGERRKPVRATLQGEDARLGGRIYSLALSDSTVVIGLENDVARVNLRTGRMMPRLLPANFAVVGPVVALAQDERTLWAAGPRGVVVLDRGSNVSRYLAVPGEIAAEPYDVALTPDWAWIATRAGLVRLARRNDGMPR